MTKFWIYFLLIIILLFLIGGGYFLNRFLKKKQGFKEKDKIKLTEKQRNEIRNENIKDELSSVFGLVLIFMGVLKFDSWDVWKFLLIGGGMAIIWITGNRISKRKKSSYKSPKKEN